MSLAAAARAAIEAAGLTEPVLGEHVWFSAPIGQHGPSVSSCAWCGICQRRDGKPQKACPGIVRVELRGGDGTRP
jgi:hypothetical protein